MLSCGLKPNVRTFTALVGALANARQWDRALEVLARMRTPAWGGVAPNSYTYTALLKASTWGAPGCQLTAWAPASARPPLASPKSTRIRIGCAPMRRLVLLGDARGGRT
jgi:pentatricopeptide repeat protein